MAKTKATRKNILAINTWAMMEPPFTIALAPPSGFEPERKDSESLMLPKLHYGGIASLGNPAPVCTNEAISCPWDRTIA